ncbi:TPA: hypothetical protein EYP66_02970 [Candidatus Poribacteria bacterium]|nr:hypothetical protein [Candidatus Poribacteria bacterium]
MQRQFLSSSKAFILRGKPFALIALVAALYLLTLNPNWKPTWDSATYITLGKSLITGHGYKYMGYSHIKYPPVFPLLLSPIIGIFGYNYLLMRLMIVTMGICSIGMAYLICRRLLDSDSESYKTYSEKRNQSILTRVMAVSVMLLSAVSYPLLFEATRILSDIPYIFFSFLALIFIDKYSRPALERSEGTETYLNKTAYLTIVFILLSYFTRLVGVSLIAAAVSHLFWRTRRESKLMPSVSQSLNATKKAVFIGLIFIAFTSAWMVRNQLLKNRLPSELREAMSYERELILVEPGASYPKVAALKDLVSRVESNLDYYEGLMTNIISGKSIKSRAGIIIISFILLCGFLARAIPNPTLIEFYTFFYVWIYLLWPSRQGERFLVPIIPFLFLYFLNFPKLIVDLLGCVLKDFANVERKISIISSSVVAIVACGFFFLNLSPAINVIASEHRTPYYQGGTADYINAILWVKENTPPDSVITTDRAPWAHLLSGRKAFTFPWVPDTQEVIDSIHKNGVTHVIAVPRGYSEAYLLPTIAVYPDKFTEIHRVGDSIIYQFNPPR